MYQTDPAKICINKSKCDPDNKIDGMCRCKQYEIIPSGKGIRIQHWIMNLDGYSLTWKCPSCHQIASDSFNEGKLPETTVCYDCGHEIRLQNQSMDLFC